MKNVFVTGITGQQGGAVANHLLEQGYNVIGLTRNASASKAESFKSRGAEIVQGDLNTPDTYASYLSDVDAIFFVQALQGKSKEIEQGKIFLDAIPNSTKAHVVYASVLGSDQNTGIPHFESKFELEGYLKKKNVAYTILRPGAFHENHLFPRVAKDIRKGKYISPLNKTTSQQMIGVDDIGKIAAQVITQRNNYEGKSIDLATGEKSIDAIVDIFAKVLNQPMKYGKLPGIIARLAMGKDVSKMFRFFNKNDFSLVKDIDGLRNEFGIESSFESWVKDHFGK